MKDYSCSTLTYIFPLSLGWEKICQGKSWTGLFLYGAEPLCNLLLAFLVIISIGA